MVEKYEKDVACPAGDAPCTRDVGQVVATSWLVKAAAEGQPTLVRLQLGGRTIKAWGSGVSVWEPKVMPVRLLTRARWRFQPFPHGYEPDVPTTDRQIDCDVKTEGCGVGVAPDFEPLIPAFQHWFWLNPGAHEVAVTAYRTEADGSLTELCKNTRSYTVPELNRDDPDRQAVDYHAQDAVPVARLLRARSTVEAFTGLDSPLRLLGSGALPSFSLQGVRLPPIFDPQHDPMDTGATVLFGSADGTETVLRIARHAVPHGQCAGGSDAGRPCADPAHCTGGTCTPPTCIGGTHAARDCVSDAVLRRGTARPALRWSRPGRAGRPATAPADAPPARASAGRRGRNGGR